MTGFEDLDDPNPRIAQSAQRQAVAERARRLTRRRRVRGLAATAIVVLVAVGAAALLVDRPGNTVRTVGYPPSPRQVLQFRLVLGEQTNDCPAPSAERVSPSDTQVLLAFPSAHSCLRVGPALLSVGTVQTFEVNSGDPTGAALVTLTASDAPRFNQVAATNLGQRVAVVMFDQILIAPRLLNPQYNGRLQLTGLSPILLDRMRKVLVPAVAGHGSGGARPKDGGDLAVCRAFAELAPFGPRPTPTQAQRALDDARSAHPRDQELARIAERTFRIDGQLAFRPADADYLRGVCHALGVGLALGS